jgi:D-lactate dehydrogenase (cytochrome)
MPFENNTVTMSRIIRKACSMLIMHGHRFSSGHQPDVVVYAESTEHVSRIVKYCAMQRLPVIPFGTGTGLEGNPSFIEHRFDIDVHDHQVVSLLHRVAFR